ncbi:pitrilysin family protein [Mesorhizobium sp. J428]|uniref:M16 family metallopeptidase n=1 Tax=Mesorhizobium sp. J428 TaxID=2898440 RepID=UPI002150D4CD|nr:pitrilysin family protein [Mesorhizobium sp. J428]MCR5858533.1 insulinase family protein [Mesorhizobium sp. J428]
MITPRMAAGRVVAFVSLVLLFALPGLSAAHAEVKIQDVVSSSGVRAWLVEDYTVPIVSIRFALRGGSTQDPVGKEGLANLMTGLFDEGAGDLDSDAFQLRLDDAGAEMSFSAGSDAIYGSMRMLAEGQDEAFALLRMAIQQPRFDAEPLNRIRDQIVAGIQASALDPSTKGEIAWREALYAGHPYARPDEGTEATLATITPDDVRQFHGRVFARGNMVVGVVGAIDAETLKRRLDELFGDLPAEPTLSPVVRAEPKFAQQINVASNLPQTTLQLAWPGIERNDPQFFAAYLMNHILGGGSFSSRLFEEVREKRGLTYGISSALVNRDYSSALVIGTSTRADRAAETLALIRSEVAKMAAEGPSQAELDFAKKYVIGAYAINNLDTSGAIARTLVELQLDGLGIDYIDRRTALIEAVTLDDVKAAAKRLLESEPAVMVLGPALSQGAVQ